MKEVLNQAVEKIKENHKVVVSEFREEVTLLISAEENTAIATLLRDECGFDILSVLTAVDYFPQTTPRFHVVYIFFSSENGVYLNVRAPIDADKPSIKTMETVYPGANWREREVWDLFGIKFEGHSDLRRLLMPPDWVGHPLRKDYPLGYEEVQYTFNFDEIDKRKPKGVI